MTEARVRVGVAGALGRMGRAVAELIDAHDGFVLAGRFDAPEAPLVAGLSARDEVLDACDVVIDFTSASASAALALALAERGGPALVLGSTGFSASEERVVRSAARRIALVKSGNFSLGVALLVRLVRQAAEALPAALYDIEILEAHHRRKIDSPSGTALLLGEAAAAGRGGELYKLKAPPRDGVQGARGEGQIGFASQRGGGFIGEHSVVFAGDEEVLTLSHSARDRSLFARGALLAARFAAQSPAGLYDMQDVLAGSAASGGD